MSEATRLEQAIAQEDLEPFNLVEVIAGCIEGYRHTYTKRQWSFQAPQAALTVNGSPELVAQLFDKIISNAVDFSDLDDNIAISLEKKDKRVLLRVSNPGPLLPEGMKTQLLQSMVSVRKENDVQNAAQSPHLGLGLYIANMIMAFHKGTLSLDNKEDQSGVVATASFPLQT
jgi:signal transduction histidine kinase